MSLPLTTEILKATYDLLNVLPPFNKWNLPDGEDIKFRVIKNPALFGWHEYAYGKHTIAVSIKTNGYIATLLSTMAHEMIHVHERHAKACGKGQHSAAFKKWADEVCRFHGFDPKAFDW